MKKISKKNIKSGTKKDAVKKNILMREVKKIVKKDISKSKIKQLKDKKSVKIKSVHKSTNSSSVHNKNNSKEFDTFKYPTIPKHLNNPKNVSAHNKHIPIHNINGKGNVKDDANKITDSSNINSMLPPPAIPVNDSSEKNNSNNSSDVVTSKISPAKGSLHQRYLEFKKRMEGNKNIGESIKHLEDSNKHIENSMNTENIAAHKDVLPKENNSKNKNSYNNKNGSTDKSKDSYDTYSKNLAMSTSKNSFDTSSNPLPHPTEVQIPDIKLESHAEQKNYSKEYTDSSDMFRPGSKILGSYEYFAGKISIVISVVKEPGEFVPIYNLQISAISKTTEMILEKVRQELIRRVSLGISEISDIKKTDLVEDKFEQLIDILIQKYFPDSDEDSTNFLRTYLKINSLGLGNLELLMSDENLEEIVVNSAAEPVWVYHKKYGWLKTTIFLKGEEQIKHYASIIGRRVGRQITVLTPLLDAHLGTGDRVNATLSPISTAGNTITIRKFSKDPWTITKFLKTDTLTAEAAALIWTAIQYEMSAMIAGGTASGKTSALNVFSSFFPPNQRIVSIEDTREIILPKFLHWVPLNTTLPNAEGKGEINMGDLLVNSLRMRPDRILVGEVRRKRETETLFEAIHTGHSVYATFHANNAKETVERLTNAPIDIPKIMLPAISMIIVQFRNRRSGFRRTFQIAEILSNGEANVILQYDPNKDKLIKVNKSISLYENITMFTGLDYKSIEKELAEKVMVLNYLVKKNIETVDGVGRVVAEYYTDKPNLMSYVKSGKNLPEDFFIQNKIAPHEEQREYAPRDKNKELTDL